MEQRGGGRTPRGKKFRGRGRGYQSQTDSPSSRSASSAASSPTAQQSPTATVSSSSTSSPVVATTPTRDDKTKVTTTQKPPKMSSPSLSNPVETEPQPQLRPALRKEDLEQEPEVPSAAVAVAKESEKKQEETEREQPEPLKVQKETEREAEKGKPIGKEVEKEPQIYSSSVASSLEEPTIPPIEIEGFQDLSSISSPDSQVSSIESKVGEALAKGSKSPKQAKTLIVQPPETERSTDAPLTVEIEQSTTTSPAPAGEVRPSSSASQGLQGHSRSGSVSPAYPYALIAPVGKPGYIGGVGILDEEVDSGRRGSRPPGMIRRASAIAAVESAVKGFSKRQWILLIVFGLIDLLSAITISLQAPFYPAEAEKKGANATEYGFVFGIFEFTVFLTSPIFGKYMSKLGAKTVFIVGILLSSLAVISFGLLDRIEDHTTFISLCLLCRFFEALGCAGFFTATFTIIACEFPASVSTTFASLETFFGLGLIVGPTLGGGLYSVGGFPLPFFVVGTCLLVTGLASSFVMPKTVGPADGDTKVQGNQAGILTILKIPTVALAALSIASTSMSLGFVSATLEPHIRMFNLTPFQTGLVFIINGGMYALTAPIFGYICDNINRPIFVTIVGNVFIFLSFLLVGPAAFMPFNTILWVTIVGLIIQGLGFGCCLVSGFIVGLQDSIKHGLPDEISTYAIASGLWTSMISLGAWVGPVAAGVLFDNFGFRNASWLILGTSATVGITIFTHTCYDSNCSSKSDSESQPLLRPISPLLGKKDVEDPRPSTSQPLGYGSTGKDSV